jgi:hypothetical protein
MKALDDDGNGWTEDEATEKLSEYFAYQEQLEKKRNGSPT